MVPHEDPSASPADQDPATLLQHFGDALVLIGAQRYPDTRAHLFIFRHAEVPDSVRQVANRFNGELTELSGSISEADDVIVRAQALLRANRKAEAKTLLQQAARLVGTNASLVRESRGTLLDLANRLGLPGPPAAVPARQTLARTQALLGDVEDRQRRIAHLLAQIEAGKSVTLDIFNTSLQLSVPPTTSPGRMFVSAGVVRTVGRPGEPREVVFTLDDRLLATVFTRGPFRVTLTAPRDFPPGWHTLNAQVKAKGLHARAEEARTLSLVQIPIAVSVNPIPMTWLPGTVVVSGKVTSRLGALEGARVEGHLGLAAGAARSGPDGTFRVAIVPPPVFGLVGQQRLRLSVFPAEPWDAPAEVEARAFVLNVLNLTMAALVVPLAVIYVRRRRGTEFAARTSIQMEELYPSGPGATEPAEGMAGLVEGVAASTEGGLHPAGDSPRSLGDRILAVYAAALHLVEDRTGVRLRPQMTLREFHRAASPRLRGQTFFQMTALAEITLYSSRPATEETLAAMLRLRQELEAA